MDIQNKQPNKETKVPASKQLSTKNFIKKSLESYTEFEERWSEMLAKFLTRFFGSLRFLNIVLFFFFLWIIINLRMVREIAPFDLYPFNLLMVIVQLFSIVLSVVVLISQKRESQINEIFQKMDFEVNVRAENEITKILKMIEDIHKELGIHKLDKELEKMKERTNLAEIKESVEQIIEQSINDKRAEKEDKNDSKDDESDKNDQDDKSDKGESEPLN